MYLPPQAATWFMECLYAENVSNINKQLREISRRLKFICLVNFALHLKLGGRYRKRAFTDKNHYILNANPGFIPATIIILES